MLYVMQPVGEDESRKSLSSDRAHRGAQFNRLIPTVLRLNRRQVRVAGA